MIAVRLAGSIGVLGCCLKLSHSKCRDKPKSAATLMSSVSPFWYCCKMDCSAVRMGSGSVAGEPTCERAIAVACSLAEALVERGYRVGLLGL